MSDSGEDLLLQIDEYLKSRRNEPDVDIFAILFQLRFTVEIYELPLIDSKDLELRRFRISAALHNAQIEQIPLVFSWDERSIYAGGEIDAQPLGEMVVRLQRPEGVWPRWIYIDDVVASGFRAPLHGALLSSFHFRIQLLGPPGATADFEVDFENEKASYRFERDGDFVVFEIDLNTDARLTVDQSIERLMGLLIDAFGPREEWYSEDGSGD